VFEVKKPGFIPDEADLLSYAQEYDPSSKFIQDNEEKKEKHMKAARQALQQLNKYLSETTRFNGYGIVTTGHRFWFVCRAGDSNVLSVSKSLHYQSVSPTLLRAMAYLISLSLDNLAAHPEEEEEGDEGEAE